MNSTEARNAIDSSQILIAAACLIRPITKDPLLVDTLGNLQKRLIGCRYTVAPDLKERVEPILADVLAFRQCAACKDHSVLALFTEAARRLQSVVDALEA